MQRCLSIGRRATKPALVTAGVLLSTYELLKQSLMQSGRLEESLSKVTSSKIGIHEGTVNSRSELLKRLKRYRMLFGIVNTSRESQILARLEHAIEDMETDVSTGALRKQPFCVVLYGNPGVGKSSFSIQLAKKLMHGRYGRFTSHDMVTLNETDEYQSEFRTSHKVVLFDDIGAAKVDRPDTTNPWRKVIDFVNNVQKTALNPNCEMKGKVYIQPDLVILTTNLDLSKTFAMVGGFMNCPEAIARRCSSVIHLKDYHTGVIVNYDGGNDHSTAYCGKMPTNLKSGLGVVITRDEIVSQLDKQFREHMIEQQKFVDKFNSYFDDLPTIDEIYEEQSEIYEMQACVAPKYDPLSEERRLNYLIANIDWDYYFCAYPEGHYSDVYYFDGYIYSSFGKYPDQAFYIHKDYMNELRQKMLDITPRPYQDEEVMDIPDLVAEGSSVSIKAESDTCIVSDFQNDAFYDTEMDIFKLDVPPIVDESHPKYWELRQFALEIYLALNSLQALKPFLKLDDYPPKDNLKKILSGGDKDKYGTKAKKIILNRIAFTNYEQFGIHPFSLSSFLICSPLFDINEKVQKSAQECILKLGPRQDLDQSLSSDSSIGTFDCPTPSNSVKVNVPPAFDWAESVDSDQSRLSCDYSTDTPPESITGDSHYRNLLRDRVNSPIEVISIQLSEESKSIHSDPNSPHWKMQTEDEQCDEFIRLINFPHFLQSRNIQISKFGEIDLVLEVEDFIFVVELKRSNHQAIRKKAKEQAQRYSNVLSILRPDTRVFGITYTYGGINVVSDNAKPFRSNVCDDLFKIIGYTKQPNVKKSQVQSEEL